MVARKAGRRGHDALKSRASKDYFGVNLGNVSAKAARVPRCLRGTLAPARDMWGERMRARRVFGLHVLRHRVSVILSRGGGGILVFDFNWMIIRTLGSIARTEKFDINLNQSRS
jgi:hypothetical protein